MSSDRLAECCGFRILATAGSGDTVTLAARRTVAPRATPIIPSGHTRPAPPRDQHGATSRIFPGCSGTVATTKFRQALAIRGTEHQKSTTRR